MASDTTAASAQELELEPPARVHRMSGHRDAIAVVVCAPAAGRAGFCAGRMRSRAPPKCVAHGPNISARSRPNASPLPCADGYHRRSGSPNVVVGRRARGRGVIGRRYRCAGNSCRSPLG
jgi:hypothetical protein